MEWGMTGFEEEEQNRPQFYGEEKLSPLVGHGVGDLRLAEPN
jgi:hypothetical protein